MLRNAVINSLVTLLSLSVAFMLAEVMLEIFPFPKDMTKPAYCHEYETKTVQLYTYSLTNYAYPPNMDLPLCGTDFFVVNKSDVDGYLGVSDIASNAKHVLVFGDSFAYGFGVKKNEAFASILGAYNAGLWGNSFPNHFQVLKRVLEKRKKFDLAVWVIYPPHLITVSDGGWQTKKQLNKNEHPWFYWLAEKYNGTRISKVILAGFGWGLNRADYYSPEWSLYDTKDNYADSGYRVFEDAAQGIQKLASSHGVRIVPLIIPSKPQIALKLDGVRPFFIKPPWRTLDADLATRRITEILLNSGFSQRDLVIGLDELLVHGGNNWRNYYWENDAHLNQRGHSFIAEVLRKRINEE